MDRSLSSVVSTSLPPPLPAITLVTNRRVAPTFLGLDAKTGTRSEMRHGSGTHAAHESSSFECHLTELTRKSAVPARTSLSSSSSPPSTLAVSTTRVNEKGKGKASAQSVGGRKSGANRRARVKTTTDGDAVVDISISDDENGKREEARLFISDGKDEEGKGEEATLSGSVPPGTGTLSGCPLGSIEDATQLLVPGHIVGSGEAEERVRFDGRRVTSWRSPTFFRSLARGEADSTSGALDWSGRACPAWLQEEMSAGTVKKSGELC